MFDLKVTGESSIFILIHNVVVLTRRECSRRLLTFDLIGNGTGWITETELLKEEKNGRFPNEVEKLETKSIQSRVRPTSSTLMWDTEVNHPGNV